MKRVILFETYFGSKLYGTNRPDSDDDFLGIFLHDPEEFYQYEVAPREIRYNEKYSEGSKNTKGDIDRKYVCLAEFFKLLSQGQSGQIEMLFSPEHLWVNSSPAWKEIVANRDMFLSKKSIVPFMEFAKSQALKSVFKGENLNKLRVLVEELSKTKINRPLLETMTELCWKQVDRVLLTNDIDAFNVGGKSFETSLKTATAIGRMKKQIDTYGPRALQAAENGYDFRSLSHAYRMVMEAEELITTGKIEFPLRPEMTEKLKMIKRGDYVAEYFEELEKDMARVKDLPSNLPEDVDQKAILDFSVELHKKLYKDIFKTMIGKD